MFKKLKDFINKNFSTRFSKVFVSFILVVLILTTAFSISLFNEGNVNKGINQYPFISISRNFIEQKNIVANLQPLRDSLAKIYKEHGEENISVYIEALNSGANISYNQDYRYYPASLIKMPVAIATVKMIEDGKWHWDDKLVIFDEDLDTGFGNVGENPIGTRMTIEELLKELLTKSDNTAYKMLLRNLGTGPVNDFLVNAGLDNFFDKELNITAKEYTRLFRSLYTSSYLTREYSQRILIWLSESERNYLGQGIPENVVYSHKFGENVEEYIFADSGIVYLENRPYLITVLYKADPNESREEIDDFFKKISQTTYDYFYNFNLK